jgi:hypothetical protein
MYILSLYAYGFTMFYDNKRFIYGLQFFTTIKYWYAYHGWLNTILQLRKLLLNFPILAVVHMNSGKWFLHHFQSYKDANLEYVLKHHVVYDYRWEVIVRFINVGGIVDNHCLNFLFNALCDNWHNCFLNIKFHYFT